MEKVMLNPDPGFVRSKRKAIKDNNGYCPNCPKTPEWKCHKNSGCRAFREQAHTGWCAEGLYYKDMEANTDVPI